MKIGIGSTNPTKIQATEKAFQVVFPKKNMLFEASIVPSGISNQPMSDKEAIKGAINRAKRVLKKTQATYGVGLEGGIQKIGTQWYECGWIAVVDTSGKIGIGSSVKIPVPEKVMQLIHNGIELGYATDEIFHLQKSKEKLGFFGVMTGGHITRANGYADGVIAALSVFLHPDLF